jgi:hypothetical protein
MMAPFPLNPKITVLEACVLLLAILFLSIIAISVTMTYIRKKRAEKVKTDAASPQKVAAQG